MKTKTKSPRARHCGSGRISRPGPRVRVVRSPLRNRAARSSIKVRGFFRVRLSEGDLDQPDSLKIIGDTGWKPNLVTNLGFDQFLCQGLGGMAGSKTISHMAVGIGGAPVAADTTLAGEITHATNSRKSVSPSTIASKTLQLTAAFNSVDSFLTIAANLSNVGLFNTSQTSLGTLFAGNTYASSAVATNQNLQISYQVRFA